MSNLHSFPLVPIFASFNAGPSIITTTNVRRVPLNQPRTSQAIPHSQSLSYNPSYSPQGGYTTQQPTQQPAQAIPISQPLGYTPSYSSQGGYTTQQPTQQPTQAVPISQPLGYTPSYSSQGDHTTQQRTQTQYFNHNSIYPPTGNYASPPSRPTLPPDVQESIRGNYPRRLIKTGIDGNETERLDSSMNTQGTLIS